jgi:hypothetical protein
MATAAQWPVYQGVLESRYPFIRGRELGEPNYPTIAETPVEAAEQREDVRLGTQPLLDVGETALTQEQSVPTQNEKGLRSFPLLTSLFSISSPIAVEHFLRKHPQLSELLFSAFPRIKSLWGADANLELSMVDDPEGGFPVLIVHVSSSSPNAYAVLDRFDDEWWLDNIRSAEGLLNFSVQDNV